MYTASVLGKSAVNVSRSRFFGFCKKVNTIQEAEQFLTETRQKYADAKHIIYVYKILPDILKKFNSSEPSGTASAPIVSLIEKQDLQNVIIVVVRYFGGVLLGTGGLVHAYSSCASLAIENAKLIELTEYYKLKIIVPYTEINAIENAGFIILERNLTDVAEYKIASKEKDLDYDKVEVLDKIWL